MERNRSVSYPCHSGDPKPEIGNIISAKYNSILNWLTKYNDSSAVGMHNKSSFGSLASQSKRTIDIQAGMKAK